VQSVAVAALSSWNFDPRVIGLLAVIGFIYVRGWIRGRRLVRTVNQRERLMAFLAGLALIFFATESPLDAFDSLFLSAHMTEHLLLMMIAPPLILLGEPMLPLLRGLPKAWVKEGLGPFLTWPALRRFFGWLTAPLVTWLIFAISTIFWHLPLFYELALGSPTWHGVQHASFFWSGILFWWPIIRPGPIRYRWPLWIGIPYLLTSDFINTGISAFYIFSDRVLYPTYEAVRMSGLTAREDQTLAGAIMWVPGSIVYLLPAVGIAMKLLSNSRSRPSVAVAQTRPVKREQGRSMLKRMNAPALRRAAQVLMLLVAIAVMADGFLGPQIAPVNLAGVLPWIHWRALSVFALLLVGNLFCMACPFTLVRDIGRVVLPAKLRWPKALRSKWLPTGLLVIYLWVYEAFGLWDSPWLTAWVIAGYFVAALVIDGLFRGASFCKYVCPIGQFHFVTSLVSPREVRVRREATCESCKTHDCIRGNEHARGCELYLFQPKKESNLDCTFCLDCVKACPHDNVALVNIAPASTLLSDPYRSSIGRLSKRSDLAALAIVIIFGAFVNAAGMVSPVMMWEHGWHARLGVHAMPFIVAAFVVAGLILLPGLAVTVCNRIARAGWAATKRLIFAMVPIGVAMWAAHLLYHIVTSGAGALPAIQRAMTHTIGGAPTPFVPAWLTPLQILLLDAGLLLTLYVSWKIVLQVVPDLRSRAMAATPWALLSIGLYAAGIWILFQPMQMRGMLH
jgi:cytochrome c oxidase assembly factor CtaG/polyferredoxin